MVDRGRPASAAGTFKLGGELEVARMAYGAMRLTGQPGNWGPYTDPIGAKRLLHRALDLGVNLIDTAHAYGPGFNEALIAQALHPYPADLVIATKGGIWKTGPGLFHRDSRPEALRAVCEACLLHLKRDRLDLFQLHWVDDKVPWAEAIGGLQRLVEEGKVRFIGICNVTAEQARQAMDMAPIASVQNRFALNDEEHRPVLQLCAERGVAFIPYGPLGAKPFEQDAPLTRATGKIAEVAREHEATTGQIALAWLLAQAPVVLPIPGTTSVGHLEENVAAAGFRLSEKDLAALR